MSTIKLYTSGKNSTWKLIASKLFKVDDISSYLATFTPTTISDFQYIKQGLEISIKIDAVQANAQPNSSLGYKYVSIINDNENIAYYYVRKTTWRSKNTIQLDLVMDVLNTFQEGSDYFFKRNTRILREHKPRLVQDNIVVTLNAWQVVASEGTINVSDHLPLLIYEEPSAVICECTILSITSWGLGYKIQIQVDTGMNYSSFKAEIERTLGGGDHPTLWIDASNYMELNLVYDDPITLDNYSVYRKIDPVQENINPVLICKNFKGTNIEDIGSLAQNWYLLYRNLNNPDPDNLTNPVECYLIPENGIKANTGIVSSNVIQASQLEEGVYYYIKVTDPSISRNLSVSFSPNSITIGGTHYKTIIEIYKTDATHIHVSAWQFVHFGDSWIAQSLFPDSYNPEEEFTLSTLPFPYIISSSKIPPKQLASNLELFDNELYWNTEASDTTLSSIDAVDRTDPKNIKLIKLPYCPYKFELSEDKIVYEGTDFDAVTLVQGDMTSLVALKLKDLSILFKNTLENEDVNPFANMKTSLIPSQVKNILRYPLSKQLESKLFNSEFYQPKLVYDSFVYNFELEKLEQNNYYVDFNEKLVLEFVMTRTINSKFMFRITDLKLSRAESNYPDVLTIGRNNEEVLYNSPYISYIRSGFNYDVKAKNISNASQWIGVGASGISAVASLALPSIPLKVAGVVGSLVSMAMSVKNAVVSTINNENALRQKVLQEQNRTVSVSGCDDVDLMSEYTGNRLKYMVYEPQDIMKEMLNDLFYYAGYASNRMGIPRHNTRLMFDYLECDAELEASGTNISQNILDELKNCFKVGVTYIHKYKYNNVDTWDMTQTAENWEVELFEED